MRPNVTSASSPHQSYPKTAIPKPKPPTFTSFLFLQKNLQSQTSSYYIYTHLYASKLSQTYLLGFHREANSFTCRDFVWSGRSENVLSLEQSVDGGERGCGSGQEIVQLRWRIHVASPTFWLDRVGYRRSYCGLR